MRVAAFRPHAKWHRGRLTGGVAGATADAHPRRQARCATTTAEADHRLPSGAPARPSSPPTSFEELAARSARAARASARPPSRSLVGATARAIGRRSAILAGDRRSEPAPSTAPGATWPRSLGLDDGRAAERRQLRARARAHRPAHRSRVRRRQRHPAGPANSWPVRWPPRRGIYALENVDLFNLLVIPDATVGAGHDRRADRGDRLLRAAPRVHDHRRAGERQQTFAQAQAWIGEHGVAAAEPELGALLPAAARCRTRCMNNVMRDVPGRRRARRPVRADRRRARRLEGAGRHRGDHRRRHGPLLHADRQRERRAQPARAQLPADLPRLSAPSAGAPAPAAAPTRWPTSTSTSRSAGWRCSSRRASTAARSGSSSSRTTSRCGRRSGSTSARSCTRCSRRARSRAQTPRDAYFVKCDKETTTQNDIDLGRVNIVVGFAPLKPAEFVIIRIQQIAGAIQT